MRLLVLFFIFFGYFNINASGQVIHLENDLYSGNLGKYVTYFEDKTAELSLNEVKALEKNGQFKHGKTEILNFGNTKSTFWIKLNYLSSGSPSDYLILDVPNIEHIDCYINTNKGMIRKSAGSIMQSGPDAITTNNYIFPLPLHTENSVATTIWLRLRTNNILLAPIKMTTSAEFIPGTSARDHLEIIYIGILFTLFLFNIFLYLSVKDSTYLYYTLYVFSLAVYVVGYLRGYAYLLGDDFRITLNLYPQVFLSISIIASILFSKKFLNLKAISPTLVKLCYFLIGCSIIMFFTSIGGFKSISAILAQHISLTGSVVLWLSGIIAYKKGHKPAKYYILAWTSIAFTVVLIVLSMWGILENHDYSFEFVPIGSTIELFLLAFALGDRYSTIMRNEQILRDENFALIQTQNQRLEKQVADRTLKLRETITQLEASNGVKNKLFSIIAHDLRSPFNSLISIFSLKDMDMLTLEELKMLLNENKKNIDTIHNTLNNLLYWAKSQMEGITNQPSVFNLKLIIEDLILVYAPLIKLKGIAINLQGSDQSVAYADENQIQLVLRNLIDNAIKFTPPSHSIGISLIDKKDAVEICVSNTISKVNVLNIKSMTNVDTFETTNGTGHEKGIGLGLHLCREYIKANNSELHIKVSGKLVSFCFQLPLA